MRVLSRRVSWAAGAVLSMACGGRVAGGAAVDASNTNDVGATDSGPMSDAPPLDTTVTDTATSDAPLIAPGCPDTQPVSTQACADGPYFCYYFLPGARCAHAWKCTPASSSSFEFTFIAVDCNPSLRVESCNDGLACNEVAGAGACVVECVRKCTCDVATSALRCASIVPSGPCP